MRFVILFSLACASILNAQGPVGPPGGGGNTINQATQAALATKVPITLTISTTAPLNGGGALSAPLTLSMTQSNTSTDGWLSHTDWNTFNAKLGTSAIGTTVQAFNANITIQGNTFNGVSQLVQLNGSGQLPAIDGHLLTGFITTQIPNLDSSKITTGSFASARLGSGGDGSGNHALFDDGTFKTLTGGGSVSTVGPSSGSLSPVFTFAITNQTTTPTIAFTLSNAAAHSYLGNNTGSSAAPAYHVIDLSELSGAVTTAQITASNVTYSTIQNVSASRLLGNPTGSPAAPLEISIGGGLSFSGSTLRAYNASQSLSGASPNADASVGKSFYETLAANTTFTFSNFNDGDTILIRCQQAATGGPWTVAFPTSTWAGGSQPVQTTTASKSTLYFFTNQNGTIYARADSSAY